jgi:hypothetical protein
MSGNCGHVTEARPALERSFDQTLSKDQRGIVESHSEELLWIAEVIVGNRHVAEECVSEAIDLAEGARDLGQDWGAEFRP